MNGPRPEHVEGDTLPDNPRVVMPFTGSSPSGDVEAEVVYANYGRPEDFKKLEDLKVDVKGKIVIVRYGDNFRGVKSFVAEEHGAAGVIIYSDPIDDGYFKGDAYPRGRGVRRAECSADPSSTCLSIRAIRQRRGLRRP